MKKDIIFILGVVSVSIILLATGAVLAIDKRNDNDEKIATVIEDTQYDNEPVFKTITVIEETADTAETERETEETEPEETKTVAVETENIVETESTFEDNTQPEIIRPLDEVVTQAPEVQYTYSDVELVAKVIQCEAGADVATDEHQRLVASVIVNRMHSPLFPHQNTISEVVYAPGQYQCAADLVYVAPSDRALANAEYVIANGAICPSNVLYQAEFIQGDGVYMKIEYPGFHTTYICYQGE